MWLHSAAVGIVGAGILNVRDVRAQTTNASCSRDGWAFNSLDQSPCQVAVDLGHVCDPDEIVTINPISAGVPYGFNNNRARNYCWCNSVIYNLYSACADCQGGIFQDWISWKGACNSSFIGWNALIPTNTLVPNWAYLNPANTENKFDPIQAQMAGGFPERSRQNPSVTESASSSGSSRINSITATAPGPTNSLGSQTPTMHSDESKTTTAIAGGVVGGVVGAVLLVALGFYFGKWRNNRKGRSRINQMKLAEQEGEMIPYPLGFSSMTEPMRQTGKINGINPSPPQPSRILTVPLAYASMNHQASNLNALRTNKQNPTPPPLSPVPPPYVEAPTNIAGTSTGYADFPLV